MNARNWASALSILLLTTAINAVALPMDSGMVTLSQGEVALLGGKEGNKQLAAFTKIKTGDKLLLSKDARVQLVYFESGRQETWKGSGQLEIGASESASASLQPEIKQLPQLLVKQLIKTPSADAKNRAGMILLRAIPASGKDRELDAAYAKLRAEADAADITPELYYLSGYFELRDFNKVKQKLAEMSAQRPDSPEVKAAVEHYTRMVELADSKPAK